MGKFVNAYIIFEIVIILAVICIAVISVFLSKRYLKNHGTSIPPGFEKTEEVTIDPKDGKKRRVYYNNRTGERFYKEEK